MNSPTVLFELDGYPLLLPAESQLPVIKRDLPHYGTNVGRLAARVARKYQDLSIIDIGANVGDTVATLRRSVGCPILCVEGCATYLELLHENLRQFSDVEVEQSFVGGDGPGLAAEFTIEKGTGYLTPSANPAAAVQTQSIERILQRHQRFAAAKLWKIDTDGWDSYILQENIRTVERVRPIIFFEYDPHFFVGALARGGRIRVPAACGLSRSTFLGKHRRLFPANQSRPARTTRRPARVRGRARKNPLLGHRRIPTRGRRSGGRPARRRTRILPHGAAKRRDLTTKTRRHEEEKNILLSSSCLRVFVVKFWLITVPRSHLP